MSLSVAESFVPEMPDRLVVRPGTTSLMVQWVPNRRSKYLVRGYYLGYGKGIPDVYRQLFDANTFFYTIENLRKSSFFSVVFLDIYIAYVKERRICKKMIAFKSIVTQCHAQ